MNPLIHWFKAKDFDKLFASLFTTQEREKERMNEIKDPGLMVELLN